MNEVLSNETNISMASALAAQYELLLVEAPVIQNHEALIYLQSASNTVTTEIPLIGMGGYDLPQVMGEVTEVQNTALTTATASVTLARYSKSYAVSGMAQAGSTTNGPAGQILREQMFAIDAIQSHALALTSLVANLGDTFSNTVGTTTVAFSVASFLAAKSQLDVAKNTGRYLALLHTTAFAHLQSNITTTSAGAIQWMPESQSLVSKINAGAIGTYLGVDIYTTSQSPLMNASADRGSCMLARRSIAWSDRAPMVPKDGFLLGNVLFEVNRVPRSDTSEYVSTSYMGVSEVIDASGVTIVAKATI